MLAALPVEGLGIRSSAIDLDDERKTKKKPNEDFCLFPEKKKLLIWAKQVTI